MRIPLAGGPVQGRVSRKTRPVKFSQRCAIRDTRCEPKRESERMRPSPALISRSPVRPRVAPMCRNAAGNYREHWTLPKFSTQSRGNSGHVQLSRGSVAHEECPTSSDQRQRCGHDSDNGTPGESKGRIDAER